MDFAEYLEPTLTINAAHPAVADFIASNTRHDAGQVETAVTLYYAVRDSIRYNPYALDFTIDGMKASTTLAKGYGWCVSKAVLLAACCRSRGIHARLGFGDVKNHLSTKKLREWMRTDVFYWHGFTEIYLNHRWVKATPAFNKELCDKFGIAPLEFDGTCDSIFHEFDRAGNKHMEYLHDRGRYADLPLSDILATFRKHYSRFFAEREADFEEDVAFEITRQK